MNICILDTLKIRVSQEGQKIDEILTADLTLHNVKSTVKISSIFVAFLGNMNFNTKLF